MSQRCLRGWYSCVCGARANSARLHKAAPELHDVLTDLVSKYADDTMQGWDKAEDLLKRLEGTSMVEKDV